MKLTDVKEGDVIVADDQFDCLKPGAHKVRADQKGQLFVYCTSGTHYLVGQVLPDGELCGFTTLTDDGEATA